VIDKGHVDFLRLHRIHLAGAFFITRPKKNMDFAVRKRQPVDAAGGVQSDRLIRLRGLKTRKRYPDILRLIRYVDPQTGKRLKFLTNNLRLDAPIIALLYPALRESR